MISGPRHIGVTAVGTQTGKEERESTPGIIAAMWDVVKTRCSGHSPAQPPVLCVWLPDWREELELNVVGVAEHQDGGVGLVGDW
jgi:hypothetical protein